MTEQPVETEQQFLGNEAPSDCANCSGRIRRTVGMICPVCERDFSDAPPAEATVGESEAGAVEFIHIPDVPLQHYAPGAHLRRPLWSPADNVELGALARKSAAAHRKLAIAKAESVKAEEALQVALGVEHFAQEEVYAANEALVAFTRKDTGL